MTILVSNDDGIYARGLWALVRELVKISDVIVVAPDREQSAVGTSVTLHQPLRIRPAEPLVEGVKAYSVEGTPGDSVIMALGVLTDGLKIDLVMSGINEGSNLGNDVLISGTVGAALQGYFHGLPSIAISVAAIKDVYLDAAAKLGALLARKVLDGDLPRPVFLNVNLPNLPVDKIAGIDITRLGRRSYKDQVKEGTDGKRKYYWIVRGEPHWEVEPGTDIWAVRHDRISITPLQTDLTCPQHLAPCQSQCAPLLEEVRHALQEPSRAS